MAQLVEISLLDVQTQAIYTAPPNLTAVLVFLAGYIESSSYKGKSLGKLRPCVLCCCGKSSPVLWALQLRPHT